MSTVEKEEQPPLEAVYGLYCHETKKWYIGASSNVLRRIREHLGALRRGNHQSIREDARKGYTFSVQILEVIEPLPEAEVKWDSYRRLEIREAWWIAKKNSLRNGYNRGRPATYAQIGAGWKQKLDGG